MFVYSWDGTSIQLEDKKYYEDVFLVYASKDADSDEFAQEKDAPVFNGQTF